MTTLLILVEVGHVFIYIKTMFSCTHLKKYENNEITGGEPSKEIDDV